MKKSWFLFLIPLIFFSCTLDTLTKKNRGARPGSLTLLAAGDNLLHEFMIRRDGKTRAYSFDEYYGEIKPLIEAADIAFINQETLLAGEAFGFSGYPQFNTPQEAGAALAAAGFDVVNHATNHIMDKGERAVFSTMDFWDARPGIAYLGIHRSQEARGAKKVIIEKNNITVGFLAYTYGTNGIPVPRDKPYLVSLIDEPVMEKEIAALRPLCDFLVVSMHWGEEYRESVTKEQQRLARFLAARNVDLILGHHPHVLEPYEYLDRPGGGRTLCFYSLGNFLSGQQTNITQLGALAYVRIKKINNVVEIDAEGIIPVVNHYEQGLTRFRVYPLYRYTEALAEKHLLRLRGQEFSLRWLHSQVERVTGKGNRFTANPFTPER
ncbi:MAG: CapA family protein [Treponema sp.]|jgi:poly-gamma-glutamate synthesis protein (capsule biosynthesis protein)|nr:CapA family protein [Treponema sp.]